MSGSHVNQLKKVFEVLFMDEEAQADYKEKHGVESIKKALRPDGDPTKPLPVILSYGSLRGYFSTAKTFMKRAKAISGKKLLVDWIQPEVICATLERHYRDHDPDTINTVLSALGKVWQGCVRLGWWEGASPVTQEMRDYANAFRDDGDVRLPRYGYANGDAERIVARLYAINSQFALAADLALRCGLRLHEIAGLQGKHVDAENLIVHVIQGKGGLDRDVPIPQDLVDKLNLSQEYLFRPAESWKHSFDRAVRRAARFLGITISGIHRLRSNCFQNKYVEFRKQGLNDAEARDAISKIAGHNRRDVVASYVPTGFDPETGTVGF
jgi:hypothetical protein